MRDVGGSQVRRETLSQADIPRSAVEDYVKRHPGEVPGVLSVPRRGLEGYGQESHRGDEEGMRQIRATPNDAR